ncbi:nucleotide exchange factor GrpE [Leptolyngbya sp. FACHB-261]|uniref:nucleotide exchange factor GrpE n=1 Tax=Leptolyngbya sp. FACHB-261 TaxID=2692806 RepID=UPI0018F00B91|nr:nucleotide exchange factor GrpE [Leptolyngbya sp. FACHB-261]
MSEFEPGSPDTDVKPADSPTEQTVGVESIPDNAADDPIEGLGTLLEDLPEDSEADGQGAAEAAALITELSQQIETLQAQLKDATEQRTRLAADFENFRKRTQREKEEQEQKIKGDTILELLPVVDNFDRARSQIKPKTDGEKTIHTSYQSVYKQLVDCLKRIGVAPMRPVGEVFDPNLHEAVMREATDQYPEDVVIDEFQRGYLLGERVLRHALVKVAAPPEPVITSGEGESAAEG